MSRIGLFLAAGAIVAAVGIVVLDQTGLRNLAPMGTVAFLALTAIVGVTAYRKASEPDAGRAARRTSQREFGRALRRGRLPDDPGNDEHQRRAGAPGSALRGATVDRSGQSTRSKGSERVTRWVSVVTTAATSSTRACVPAT